MNVEDEEALDIRCVVMEEDVDVAGGDSYIELDLRFIFLLFSSWQEARSCRASSSCMTRLVFFSRAFLAFLSSWNTALCANFCERMGQLPCKF